MKLVRTVAVVLLTGGLLGISHSLAFTDPVLVDTFASQNRRWEAVFTNEVALNWEWREAATSAQLEIVGMNRTDSVSFTEETTTYLWQAFSGDTPSVEDVYDLTLTFYENGSEIDQLTARLAVVKGAFGETDVITTPESTPWPRIEKNVVIPYDAGWLEETAAAETSELTVTREENSMTQSYPLSDTSGYFGWDVVHSDWGYGTFNLALTFPDTNDGWNGTLIRLPQGTLIQVR